MSLGQVWPAEWRAAPPDVVEPVWEGPRILAYHRGSFHVQIVHVHPPFSSDGRQVLYTRDPDGYGQVHLLDVPDFESLPVPEEG